MSGPQQLNVPLLDRHRYADVGFCVYCGRTDDLRDEHIVPFGLGGNLVLPKATCGICARLTGRSEQIVLRGPFRPIRVFRGIQSRTRHRDAPTVLPLRVRYDDRWETIKLPHEEYPLLLHFPVFDVPGCLDPKKYRGGIRLCGHMTYSFGPRPEEVRTRFKADQIEISQTYVPSEFAKMTAKVAYSMSVAVGAVDPSRGRPEVVRSILGEVNDIGRWVGTMPQPRQWLGNVLHFVGIERDKERLVVKGRVQFLTNAGTPVYCVVLGDLADEFVRPATR
jgi:hypothetical protein